MFEIKRYNQEYATEWNSFNAVSRQGTFLLDRNYMDYHSDRFHDHSLMFYLNWSLFAILPANEDGDYFHSHQGLTYGGLITNTAATAANIIKLFEELNEYLRVNGFKHVIYKCIPWIYHRIPSEEDLYGIYRSCNAHLISREISSTIDFTHALKWRRDRKYGINKAINNNIKIEANSNDFNGFWKVLCDNLMISHHVNPVHSLTEMQLLKSRFPNNIILYVARKDNEVIGGTVLYLTSNVVHSQYISANPEGKHLRVVDAIYNQILHQDFISYHYFDFGKSTEDKGHFLNESLIYQKEGFGGRGIIYDTYEWDL